MDKHILAEQKLTIFQSIMQIENETTLKQVQIFLNKFLSENNSLEQSSKIIKPETILENEFDASILNFEEWNQQFEGSPDMSEYVPEYGMSLKEFRLMIYNSEKSPSYPIKNFYDKLEAYV